MRSALLLAALLAGCSEEPAPAPPTEPTEHIDPAAQVEPTEEPVTPTHRTRLVLLGTGTPNADPERSGPSVAVVVDDVAYLVDAGPGVVRRASAAARAGEGALEPHRIEHAFLTHLHSDHTVGLPDLVLTPWVLGRARPLSLIGPPGTARMARHVLEAWSEDIAMRTEGLEGANETGWRVEAREVEPGVVYRDARVTVRAIAVEHGAWRRAYGYRFEGPDRTIVISGDTAPCEALVAACDGCDLLVHEAYSAARYATLSASWRRYHGAFHTSGVALGELAARARPGALVLYHHLLWGAEPEELVAEVRRGFDGDVRFGNDLDVF